MRTPRANLNGQQIHECDFCQGEVGELDVRNVRETPWSDGFLDACPDCHLMMLEEGKIQDPQYLAPQSLAQFVEATLANSFKSPTSQDYGIPYWIEK